MISLIGKPYCQKVLPLVYDESLSYYEQVCKLVNKVNELINMFTDWTEVIEELQEAIKDIDGMKHNISVLQNDIVAINEQINSINTVIQSLDDYVKAMEQRYDKRFAEDEQSISALAQVIGKMQTNIDAKINALREELVALFNSFTFEFEEELEMLQLKFNQLKVNVFAQLDELRRIVDEIDTSVINPWHSELGKVSQQKNVNLMYRDLADSVPLANDYCMCNMTASEYSNLGMTALDYVLRGMRILKLNWVFSPVYGWRQEINNVLTSIVDWFSKTMNAAVYTECDLTADDYSALNLSAQDYYTFNPERVGLFVENGVLQSNQYILAEEDGVLSILGGTTTETDGVLEIT